MQPRKYRRSANATGRRRSPLPCVFLLPLIFLATLLNKSIITPSSSSFIRVTGFSFADEVATKIQAHTQVTTVHNRHTHPLSNLLHSLITTFNQSSLISTPCARHASIAHPLLQLLKHSNRLSTFQYTCQDPDSRNLANAHGELSSIFPGFSATFKRGNFSKDPLPADVLLTGAVDIDKVRDLLLNTRATGVRFAVLRAAPMPGLPWLGTEDPIMEFTRVYSDAPFPFSHALVGVSRAYGFGENFVLVYDLTYLPKVSKGADLTKLQVERDLIRANMGMREVEHK